MSRPLSLNQARARAKKGAAFLDENVPGWHEHIDTDGLDMEYGMPSATKSGCILCQVAPLLGGRADYDEGVLMLGMNPEGRKVVSLGFATTAGMSLEVADMLKHAGDPVSISYERLTEAWKEEIAARRAVA